MSYTVTGRILPEMRPTCISVSSLIYDCITDR